MGISYGGGRQRRQRLLQLQPTPPPQYPTKAGDTPGTSISKTNTSKGLTPRNKRFLQSLLGLTVLV